jgi:hypothetical protein
VDLSSRVTADWTQVDLDLTPFVGQVVSLRFHLDATQLLPEGGASVGLWLDDVTMQEVSPMRPTEIPSTLESPLEVPLPEPSTP